MYKMIVFDIDGTLVNHLENELSKNILNMFEKLKKKGYIVTLATGRDFVSISKIHENKNIDFYIGANGSFIYDLKNKKYLFNDSINFNDYKKLYDNVFYDNVDLIDNILLSDSKNVYILENKKIEENWFWEPFRPKFKDINKAENELLKNDFHLITVSHNPKNSKILELTKKYLKRNKEINLHIQAYWPKGFFIANKNITKAHTIKILADFLKINMSEIIAFGDGENDIEMIKFVGLGIAMGNGIQALKEIADDITIDVKDFGTVYFLEKMGII